MLMLLTVRDGVYDIIWQWPVTSDGEAEVEVPGLLLSEQKEERNAYNDADVNTISIGRWSFVLVQLQW